MQQLIKTRKDLKEYRKKLKLSQKKFGRKFGVSEITIRRLEIGITALERSYTIRLINDSIQLKNTRLKYKEFY